MTKEEIASELAYRMTQKYLIYLAMQEIMLDNYEDVRFLKDYDHDLWNKHKNMVSSLKRNASKAFRFLQGYDEGEVICEALHSAIDKGGDKYTNLLDDIELLLIKHGYKEEDPNFPKPTE